MTVFLRAFLFCDAPEHDEGPFDSGSVPDAATKAESRRQARRAGWHRTHSGRDICPDCWDRGQR